MPLIHGKSKKAFKENVETEMKANPGKDNRAQNLAIAYSIKRRAAKKKMAQGGEITADTEKRPMPDQTFDDSKQTARKGDMHKASGWLDNDKEAGKSGPIKSNEADEDFVSEDMTDTEKARTALEMNMEKESSTDPKNINKNHKKDTPPMLAEGGLVDFDTESRPTIDNEDEDESMAMEREGSTDPKHINADHKKDVPQMLAHGGDVDDHYDSIADAILAKKRRAKMMAEGGQVDLAHNAEEGNNYEDELSFDALRKENYSETPGLDALDSPEDSNEHGMDLNNEEKQESLVESIRRKSKKNKYQP